MREQQDGQIVKDPNSQKVELLQPSWAGDRQLSELQIILLTITAT